MKTIKLTDKQAEMVIQAISAFIREEQREEMAAEKKGLNIMPYIDRIEEFIFLKRNIINQTENGKEKRN